MRISDWSSDVCSSDLDIDVKPLKTGCLVVTYRCTKRLLGKTLSAVIAILGIIAKQTFGSDTYNKISRSVFMDFSLSEEQAELRRMVHDFARREVAPAQEQRDRDHDCPYETWEKWSKLGMLGILNPQNGREA